MRGPVATDRPAASDPTAGHVDKDGDRPERTGGFDGCSDIVVVDGGATHSDHRFTQLVSQLAGALGIEVEHHYAQSEILEAANGGGTEPTRPAGDDSRASLEVHRTTTTAKRPSRRWRTIVALSPTAANH